MTDSLIHDRFGDVLDELLDLAAAPDRVRAALDSIHEPARLAETISPAVLRLAMAVAARPHFESLAAMHPDMVDRLTVARDFVIGALPGLALASAVGPEGIAALANDGIRTEDFVRSVRSVGHANVWFGRRDALVPAVRLVVTDVTGEHALDQVVDWPDLLFLAQSCLTVLADSLREGVGLVSPDTVGSFLDALPETLSRTDASLNEIRVLAEELSAGTHAK
jgi:hypothetical protein